MYLYWLFSHLDTYSLDVSLPYHSEAVLEIGVEVKVLWKVESSFHYIYVVHVYIKCNNQI